MRLRRVWVILAAAAVLLAGCRVDTKVDVTVKRDGSGDVQTTIALDADALARAGGIGAASKQIPFADLRAAGWTISPWEADDKGGASITIEAPFANSSELATRLEQLSGSSGILRDSHVTRDRGWFGSKDGVSMVVDLRNPKVGIASDSELAARLKSAGLDPAALDAQFSRELGAAMHLTVNVHLPGGHTRTINAASGKLGTVAVTHATTNYDAIVKLGIGLLMVVLAGLLFLAASVGKRRDRRRQAARATRIERERAPLM
jgi:hypothetical protein